MSLIRPYWKLALACLLGVLQVGIVAAGLFAPHVSPGYRAYFIDHTIPHRTDWWPGPDMIPEMGLNPLG